MYGTYIPVHHVKEGSFAYFISLTPQYEANKQFIIENTIDYSIPTQSKLRNKRMTKKSASVKHQGKKTCNKVVKSSKSSKRSGQANNNKVKRVTKPKPLLPPECDECDGTGVLKCCDKCDGTGETWEDFHGMNGYAVQCDYCGGEPEEEECESCGGNGRVVEPEATPVKEKKGSRECYKCHGEGNIPNCRKCKDTGKHFVDFHGVNGFEVDCDKCGGDCRPNTCARCNGTGQI